MVAKKHLDVVCGIITNELNQVLIALRNQDQDQGGLWEFPGGKAELGEALGDALCRELFEELDLDILEADPWLQINHEYPMYHITLHVWKVLEFEGEPEGREGQIIRWVDRGELLQLKFPPANKVIVDILAADQLGGVAT